MKHLWQETVHWWHRLWNEDFHNAFCSHRKCAGRIHEL